MAFGLEAKEAKEEVVVDVEGGGNDVVGRGRGGLGIITLPLPSLRALSMFRL